MNCEFVGWCALGSPAWIAALTSVASLLVTIGIWYLAYRIESRQRSLAAFQKSERTQRRIQSVIYRARLLVEDGQLTEREILPHLDEPGLRVGLIAGWLDAVAPHFDRFRPTEDELDEFGPDRALLLMDASDAVDRVRVMMRQATRALDVAERTDRITDFQRRASVQALKAVVKQARAVSSLLGQLNSPLGESQRSAPLASGLPGSGEKSQ